MTLSNQSQSSGTSQALQDMNSFLTAHSVAGRFLHVATNDYAAARCLMQCQLMTSLVMGSQALEKYLKAYLLLVNPDRNIKKESHKIVDLLNEVDGLAPNLTLSRFMPLVNRFKSYYESRYPDQTLSTNMTTADIIELDELVLLVNENLPCPKTVKYRTGLYGAITFSVDHPTVSPTEHWLKLNNQALAPVMSRIVEDQIEVLTLLHPGWPYDK